MATLDDLKTVLDSINTNISSQSVVLSSILTSQEQTRADQERLALLARAERSQAPRGPAGTPQGGGNGRGNGSGRGGAGRGFSLGALGGGALGAVGLAAGGAAAGIAALGLAMPAFFGGLLAGEAGLEWLSQFGSGFNFENLKAAAIGFTDMITEIDRDALVTLGGLMGISAIAGRRGATGLGLMGLAITGFLGGLLAGDATFEGFSALGGDFNFSAMKAALVGFSDMILAIDDQSLTVLAGIMGLSAVSGLVGRDATGAAKALGSMGLGITSFLGGLLAGDLMFAGVDALGGDIDFPSLKTAISGFSDIIDSLSPAAATALAGILGASGIAAIASRGTGLQAALRTTAIMTGIGAGIAGLMIGLTAGDAAISWLQNASNADGSGLTSAFTTFNDSIAALNDPNALTAFAAILGAGGGIGAIVGAINPGAAAMAALGITAIMTGIGAGISGFMIGLTAGDAAISWLQGITGADGSGLVSAFKMFNDSILQITPEAITKMQELAAIGGIDLGLALGGLSAGMVALFGAGGLAQLGEGLKQGALDAIDWLFGTNYGDSNKSTIQYLVDSLEPLNGLDTAMITKMDEFGGAVERFAASFATLSDINTEAAAQNLTRMIADLGGVLELFPYLMNGGTYYGGRSNWLSRTLGTGRDEISFGPEGQGLNSLDFSKLEDLARGINTIRSAFSGVIPEETLNGMATVNEAGAAGASTPTPPAVVLQDNRVTTNAPTIAPSSTVSVGSAGRRERRELEELARPGGVQ